VVVPQALLWGPAAQVVAAPEWMAVRVRLAPTDLVVVVVLVVVEVLATKQAVQAALASWYSGINCDHEDLHEVRREQAVGSVLPCA